MKHASSGVVLFKITGDMAVIINFVNYCTGFKMVTSSCFEGPSINVISLLTLLH